MVPLTAPRGTQRLLFLAYTPLPRQGGSPPSIIFSLPPFSLVWELVLLPGGSQDVPPGPGGQGRLLRFWSRVLPCYHPCPRHCPPPLPLHTEACFVNRQGWPAPEFIPVGAVLPHSSHGSHGLPAPAVPLPISSLHPDHAPRTTPFGVFGRGRGPRPGCGLAPALVGQSIYLLEMPEE